MPFLALAKISRIQDTSEADDRLTFEGLKIKVKVVPHFKIWIIKKYLILNNFHHYHPKSYEYSKPPQSTDLVICSVALCYTPFDPIYYLQ